jgi:hypothetical protein
MADERPFIRVHDGMPDHPKVDGLSDKAFRLLVETWCWCNRQKTDGRVPAARWRKQHTKKARQELIDGRLAEELPGGDIQMHDYLEHQRSAVEMADMRAVKSQGGTFGNHKRWHVDRGLKDPDCAHCSIAPPIGSPTPPPIAKGSDSDRTTIASSSVSDQGPTVPRSSSVDHHLRPQTREASTDDDQSLAIDKLIAGILADETGRQVEPQRAAEIRRELLAARPGVRSPMAYVAKAVRANPQRFAPPRAPSDRTVAEAVADATRGDS